MKENQYTEEEILDNNETSPMFEEFLQILGEKVRLKGTDLLSKFLSDFFIYHHVRFLCHKKFSVHTTAGPIKLG